MSILSDVVANMSAEDFLGVLFVLFLEFVILASVTRIGGFNGEK